MLERLKRTRARGRALARRFRRFEQREFKKFRRWIADTGNLLHVTVLLIVPLLIGFVTLLSNTFEQVSFLLFPPLAAGAYTLFSDPQGEYSSPWRFVAGLTAGGFSGWIALEVAARVIYHVPPGQFHIQAGGAALGVFLTGIVTWMFDLEEPAAFSTALLVLVTATSQLVYVVSIAISSTIVAGVFILWRRAFYEERARYLYQTKYGDDHVLVPMRGDDPETAAIFGARLAAAHDAGKVVLLDLVPNGDVREAELNALDDTNDDDIPASARNAAERLERRADRLGTQVDVPCEVIVMTSTENDGRTVLQAVRETNSDLIVVPYEERDGRLSPFIRTLFGSTTDVIVLRSTGERTRWRRILVPVRRSGDVAHAMLDFAQRLAGRFGHASVCHCISRERQRRSAERMLADLVETFGSSFETRVAKRRIERFLEENAASYDLTIIGSSTDRTTASRFISPPTFHRLHDLECDVAIVHRG